MSGEGRDTTYKPAKKHGATNSANTRQSNRRTTKRVDYEEVDIISSGGESEETTGQSESGFGSSVQSEKVEKEKEGDLRGALWTPGTLRCNTVRVTEQLSRLAEASSVLVMAREEEKTEMEKIMEMMLEMQIKERDREDERERRQEQLLETLKGAQTSFPRKST